MGNPRTYVVIRSLKAGWKLLPAEVIPGLLSSTLSRTLRKRVAGRRCGRVSSMTPRDLRRPWWFVRFGRTSIWFLMVAFLLSTLGFVRDIINGSDLLLGSLGMGLVILVGLMGVASARWRRNHDDAAGDRSYPPPPAGNDQK